MTLQLPGFLNDRIRGVSRSEALLAFLIEDYEKRTILAIRRSGTFSA